MWGYCNSGHLDIGGQPEGVGSLPLKLFSLNIYVYECFAYIYVCTVLACWCPQRWEGGVRSPGTINLDGMNGYELSSGCWELKPVLQRVASALHL